MANEGTAGRRRRAARARPPAAGDAPSSNTASHGYRGEGKYRLLRVGVDSLYLSYYGDLLPEVDGELAKRKYHAQSRNPDERALAEWVVGKHVFEVSDRGQPNFAYVLRDNSYRLALRSGSGKVPVAYVQVSSELLAHQPLAAIADELREIIGKLAESDGVPIVSRVDIYADFQTDMDIGVIPWEAWITQASGIDTYSRGGKFTGWVFGAGSIQSARLYDKTAEVLKSGKTYFHELWEWAGWGGNSTVWRLEFQFRREVLAAFRLLTLSQVSDKLGGLWQGAVTSWLRLAVPDPRDSNRARWPLDPLWERLSEIRWRLDDQPLTRFYTPARLPSLEKLFRMYMALLVSYMAAKGIRVYGEAAIGLMEDARAWHEGWCRDKLEMAFEDWLEQKRSLKVRQFNTRRNVHSVRHDASTPPEVERDAAKYYKRSRGK